MLTPASALFVLCLTQGPIPIPVQDRPPPAVPDATRALFVASCAQCHGEKGDGEGVTQLDRKARSFLEGGFSYGNTKDAIRRSITHGIPGTPMPSFEKALKAEQVAALADYVIALGPERIVVDPTESEMVVRDRPLVVRGKLPPLVEGGSEIARGLAVGIPAGLTFEYRADEVQLLGVRAGRFVNRTDWGERGGTTLEMLGRVVWTPPAAAPRVTLAMLARDQSGIPREPEPARAELVATAVEGDRARVEYALTCGEGAGARHVLVREQCEAFRDDLGSGFVQRRTARAAERGTYLAVADLPADAPFLAAGPCGCGFLAGERPALVVARARTSGRSVVRQVGPRLLVELPAYQDQVVELIVLTDLAPGTSWTPAFQELVIRRFCR